MPREIAATHHQSRVSRCSSHVFRNRKHPLRGLQTQNPVSNQHHSSPETELDELTLVRLAHVAAERTVVKIVLMPTTGEPNNFSRHGSALVVAGAVFVWRRLVR